MNWKKYFLSIQRKQGKSFVDVEVAAGTAVDRKKDIIPAGTEILATVFGKGLYDSESSNSTVFTYVEFLLNKATIKLDVQTYNYTGDDIEISESALTVKVGGRIIPSGAYRITSISNNNGKGNAKLTITGVGLYDGHHYGGSKTVTFKIAAKQLN